MELQQQYEMAKAGHIKRYRYDLARQNAKNKVPNNLDYTYLVAIAPEFCPIFNVRMLWDTPRNCKLPEVPVLERIIVEKGYVKGNVAWVSKRASDIRRVADEEQMYAVANWLTQKRKEVINGGARPPRMDDPAFTYLSRPHYTPVVNDEAARKRGQY